MMDDHFVFFCWEKENRKCRVFGMQNPEQALVGTPQWKGACLGQVLFSAPEEKNPNATVRDPAVWASTAGKLSATE